MSLTLPAGRAGAVARISVSDCSEIPVAGTPPTVTVGVPEKSIPLIVSCGPAVGAPTSGVDEKLARRRLEDADRARTAYVKHFYRTDPADCRHYHLVIDTTVIPIDTAVDLVVRAAQP